jgi:hypothetical protein
MNFLLGEVCGLTTSRRRRLGLVRGDKSAMALLWRASGHSGLLLACLGENACHCPNSVMSMALRGEACTYL